MHCNGFLLLALCACATATGPAIPVFSDSYYADGVLYLPYAEIKEPISCYYDKPNKKSRVDYYDDLMQTFQRADIGANGVNYKFAYMPNDKGEPIHTCFQINGTQNSTVTVQSILPDLTNFEYVRMDACPSSDTHKRNEQCERWEMTDDYGKKVNKYAMFIQRDTSGNPIPKYYIMKGFDSLLGSHYDKYMVEYNTYFPGPVSSKVFDIDNNVTCRGFPGPGLTYVPDHNPIREFINRDDSHIHREFEAFKEKHGKTYEHEKEHEQRKSNFRQNYRYIVSKNRAAKKYRMKVNHLADMTDHEMKVLRGRIPTRSYNGGKAFNKKNYNFSIPDTLDWRIYGAVTPVKDQAVCGSCWSFGTTGTIEGAYFLKTGNLVRLSQQQLIDCSWNDQNNGCDGGEDFRAYQYIQKAGGLASEEAYGPYLGVDGYCHEKLVTKTVNLKGFVNVTSGDSEALRMAVSKRGPISVGIDASHKSFSFYSDGVYYDSQCGNKASDLDHSVLVVGYGTLNGENYWLVKNSWSTYWGNDGYILMSQKDNNCGVATEPTFVLL